MTQTVQFIGTRQELRDRIALLGKILSGDSPDQGGIMRSFLSAVGFAALTDIKAAFIQKARGGTDEMGIRWKPLAPATIANRRVGPRDRARADIKARLRIVRREEQKAFLRFSFSDIPEKEARRRARIVAQQAATRETGKTKVQTLGDREVEILRDTSVLFNSLSPGEFQGGEYQKPTTEGGEEQIFEIEPGQVGVGTNVIYASTHQRGWGNIPARPYLPSDEHPVPAVWWERWSQVANKALVIAARLFFSRGGK